MRNTPVTGALIIVSGPIGAGKSAVSRELIASADGTCAYIHGDDFWAHIAGPRNAGARRKHFQPIMRSMTAAAVAYALSGYDTILDFSMPPWFLSTVSKIAAPRNVDVDYIVLRPSEAICAQRAASRREGRITDYRPYHDLFADFSEVANAVEDGEATPSVIATTLREELSAGRFRVVL